uniref:Uncharacterized protein MANES_02G084200 n=1 Tax=Rhizophora mucronata TaxID=61149 RepID=A0A2P2JNG7_RHIMU
MTDDTITVPNGLASKDNDQPAEESFYDDVDQQQQENETKLKHKIEALEQDKALLSHDNRQFKDQVARLTAEIDSLKSDEADLKVRLQVMEQHKEQSEESKRALEAIAARAADLETDVSRLQHDLISAMTEGEEANAEVSQLKKALAEKESKLEETQKERVETDRKLRDLERKVGVLEVREMEEKSKKVRIEEEMREKVAEKEREIVGYKTRNEELEKQVVKREVLEAKLRESEEKAREMEAKMLELQQQVEEAGDLIGGMKGKTVQSLNGIEVESTEKGLNGLNAQWPVLAVGSTCAIAVTAAVVYVCYAKRN